MASRVYTNSRAIALLKAADEMEAYASKLEKECPYLTDVVSELRMDAFGLRSDADNIEEYFRKKPNVTDKINSNIIEAKSLGLISTKDISDGHHTFRELYNECTCLLTLVCNSHKEISWKSKTHFDNENDPMFEGNFIIGIETPEGIASFHIPLKYWEDFNITELETAKQYDGHNKEEDIRRLYSICFKER